ncbi:MAG TPA: S9 family peptidase [Gemmatimonadaceae bacterium]|jgi:oligopeptidase B|nr:S9 family peptidase [Gemmatimonadaceae bacterium]
MRSLPLLSALAVPALSLSIVVAANAQDLRPPVAALHPKVDTLHGEIRTDNYFWLREKTSPDVIAYLNAENAYTDAKMRRTEALQKKLYDEMLSRIRETDVSVPYRENGYYYSTRTEKGKSYAIRVRRKGSLNAPEEVFLDDNALAVGKKFSSVGDWAITPGGNRLAYLHDTTALRVYTLYIKDLSTGKLLADSISRVVPSVAWANDTVLFYQTADSARRSDAVWRHVVGTPQSSDVEVFHENDVLDNVGVGRAKDGKFMMIYDDGFTSSEWRAIPTANPFAAPIVLAARRPNVEYQVDHIDGAFLMTTNDGAQNFKVMRIADDQIGKGQWTDFIPTSDSVFIEYLEPFRNHLVVVQRSGGLRRLRVMDLKTRRAPFYITFPEPAYAVSPTGNAEFDSDTLRFSYQSMVTPPTTYDYSMATRQRVVKKKLDVPGFDPSRYEVKRFMVRARDGAMVPVSLIVGKNWKQDGTHPLLEYAYGSYGSTTEAGFNSSVLSLVDRGFGYAIAHIRGGQEMGRAWYDQGKMMNKKNTFNDFVDVGQYLVDNKYTSKDKLIANGGSAGGLLMGAVANMRPDLYRAIVADVPFVDVINTMMDASIPLTAQEWQQWGDPHDSTQYAYMRSYSPYDNVARKNYPWMLVTTSLNDSQVGYWEPAKWVAKLRAMKTDNNPLYLKTNMAGGHGGSSGRYDVLRERAFRYAFMLDAVGISD